MLREERERGTDLGNDLEPSIDADTPEAVRNRGCHFRTRSVLEPERQESQGVLQGVSRRESDRSEEGCRSNTVSFAPLSATDWTLTLNRWYQVVGIDLRWDGVVLVERLGEVRDDLRVSQRPRVPCLVPRSVEVRSEKVRLEDVGDEVLRWRHRQLGHSLGRTRYSRIPSRSALHSATLRACSSIEREDE
jgi:hypothetical protein